MTEEQKKQLAELLASDDPNLSPCPDCRIRDFFKLRSYFNLSEDDDKPRERLENQAKYPSVCANHRIL